MLLIPLVDRELLAQGRVLRSQVVRGKGAARRIAMKAEVGVFIGSRSVPLTMAS